MNYSVVVSRLRSFMSMCPLLLLLLLQLLLICRPSESLDPSTNAAVPACLALSQALGPQVLAQCHVMLPPKQFGHNTKVNVSIEVKTVYGLGDSELMEWSGWILMTWKDPRLAWNASVTGVQQLRIDRTNLWLPDIGYWNVRENEMFDFRNLKFHGAIASPDGSVYVYTYTVIQFPCSLDMRLFPFDQQTCTLEIGAINSDSSIFSFSLSSHISSSEDGTAFFGVGEWDLKGLTQEYKYQVTNTNQSFQYANLRFNLQRRITYYVVLIIIPYELLSLLASIMFIAEQQGDRANVSITIIMSMTLYVLIASQSAPKSMSYITLVGTFLIVQMLLLIAFTFVAIIRPEQQQSQSDDEVKAGCWNSCLMLKCRNYWIRRKDMISFICYIMTSALNALIFLVFWPLAARDSTWDKVK